jgi:hypothetical protein
LQLLIFYHRRPVPLCDLTGGADRHFNPIVLFHFLGNLRKRPVGSEIGDGPLQRLRVAATAHFGGLRKGSNRTAFSPPREDLFDHLNDSEQRVPG